MVTKRPTTQNRILKDQGIPKLVPFQRVITQTSELNRIQDNIANTVNPMLALPILSSSLIEDVLVDGSNVSNRIDHKLGRKLRGYIIVKSNVDQSYYDDQDNNVSQESILILKCNADAKVSVLCF